MAFRNKILIFFGKPLKVERRKFAVESDWSSKKAQNEQNLVFSKK